MGFIINGDQNVVIGSGDLYAVPLSEITNPLSLSTEDEAKLKYLGYIEANAVLNVAIEKQEIEAANAGVIANPVRRKTITFETGIMSWSLKNISELLTGSKYNENVLEGTKTFTYSHEDQSPNVFLRFIKKDEVAGKEIVIDMYKGSFNDDLTFDFNNDKQVTFNYNFQLLSYRNPATDKYDYYKITESDLENEEED